MNETKWGYRLDIKVHDNKTEIIYGENFDSYYSVERVLSTMIENYENKGFIVLRSQIGKYKTSVKTPFVKQTYSAPNP